MKIIDYFRSIFSKKDAVAAEFNEDGSTVDEQRFHLTELALFTAIDFIARSLAKCEFVTVNNNRESRKAEYCGTIRRISIKPKSNFLRRLSQNLFLITNF